MAGAFTVAGAEGAGGSAGERADLGATAAGRRGSGVREATAVADFGAVGNAECCAVAVNVTA